jgi:hypothetical protein
VASTPTARSATAGETSNTPSTPTTARFRIRG